MVKSTIAYQQPKNSFEKFLSWTDEKEVLAKEISQYIKSNYSSLLDVGAGNGDLTKRITQHFSSITAVEPSATLYKKLAQQIPSATLINDTIENYQASQKFDFILVSHVMHYVSQPSDTIHTLKSWLNPGGQILVVMLDQTCSYMQYIDTFKYQIYKNKQDAEEFRWTDLITILSQNNYSYTVKDVISYVTAPSAEEYVSINDFHFNTDTSQLSKELINEMSAYLKSHTLPDGRVRMNVKHKFIAIN